MFGFTTVKKNSINYIDNDWQWKPETQEMIDYIESLLTSHQLETLKLSGFGKSFSFKDRMLRFYGHMYPANTDIFKTRAQEIIKKYTPLFDKGVDFHMNEEFIKRLGVLFFPKKCVSPEEFFI